MKRGIPGWMMAGAMLAATAVRADTDLTDKANGAVYVLGQAADGTATLVNKLDGEMDRYTLMPNCYAEHPIYGTGAWLAADGGWRIMVQGTQIVGFDGPPPLESPACVPQ